MKLDKWCCLECEINFYTDVDQVSESLIVFCPNCGDYEHTVNNTIPESNSLDEGHRDDRISPSRI